ncbi:MAG TPA: uroporphyrinogen decarboxylase family protein [Candidatus Bathyarchaeia archaeon]|nr:uroporphyrinogen decarboxylase family protein [Candidatus Bathyarchaeia archaeon]
MKLTNTSREKVVAALRNEKGEIPVVPLSTAHSATLLNIKIPALRRDTKLNVESQAKAWERYGYDGIFAYSDLSMFWESMGGRVKISEDGLPSQENMLSRLEDADTLIFPDVKEEGNLKAALEALKELDKRFGREVAILIGTVGPFTLAGALRGIDFFMMDVVKKPILAENLLKRCRDFLIGYMEEVKRSGALIVLISDPMASLISPSMFDRFALPYERDVFEKIRMQGMYSILHICGDATAILPKMKKSGTDCLWLDQKIDLGNARKIVGQICLMGNVDPVSTLLLGTPRDVKREAARCIEGASNDCGFILSAGCEIPMKTPPENLAALVETARGYTLRRR